MRVVFFALMLLAILGVNFYVFYRLWQMMPPVAPARTVLVVLGVVLALSPIVSVFLGGYMPQALTAFLYRIGSAWLIIMLYSALAFLLIDIINVTRLLPVKQYLFGSWGGFAGFVAVIAAVMIAGYVNYNNKEKVELNIAVDKQMPSGPLKIVAASDLHLGFTIGPKELGRWVDMINAEQPDIILLAGDLIDNNVKVVYDRGMDSVLRRLSARYGVFAAPGNHEYISGIGEAYGFYDSAGITLLADNAAPVADSAVWLIGRDDLSNGNRKTIAELAAGTDRSRPIIMLDHQPYALEQVEENGIDIQISGHTHDGQVWPLSLVTKAMYEVSHGYKKKGDSHIYVSSGLGIWGGKFRIGTRSEYVVINLSGKE